MENTDKKKVSIWLWVALVIAVLMVIVVSSRDRLNKEKAKTNTKTSTAVTESTPAVVTTTVPEMVIVATTVPEEKSITISTASFKKDNLDECVDIVFAPNDPNNFNEFYKKFSENKEKIVEKIVKTISENTIVIAKTCNKQFKDKVVFATCAFPKKVYEDGVNIVVHASYYNVRNLDNDSYMKDCLSGGGDWEVADKDRKVTRESMRQRATYGLDFVEESLANIEKD